MLRFSCTDVDYRLTTTRYHREVYDFLIFSLVNCREGEHLLKKLITISSDSAAKTKKNVYEKII
jgi:hypothetical protein